MGELGILSAKDARPKWKPMHDAFIRLVAESLREERFTLVDIGCSGGLEPIWRLFGKRFAAIGFDPSVAECRQLVAEETSPNVHYVCAFAGIPPDHPFAKHAADVSSQGHRLAPVHAVDIIDRTSARWASELQAARIDGASDRERMQHNAWHKTELADADKPIHVPEVLPKFGLESVDFLKIDVDGADFLILNSFDGLFGQLGTMGVRLEVYMHGGPGDTAHTFHNTDRFMRRQGYVLVRLDNISYSMRALPSRFAITMPAQTVSGRIVQAEAYYARDPVADRDFAKSVSTEKLAKLAAIFSAWQQPDCAAEILVAFRDRLCTLFDVDRALDMLAAQTQSADVDKDEGEVQILSYCDYMALYAAEPSKFYPRPYPSPAPRPTLRQRIDSVFSAWSDWHYAKKATRNRERWLDEKRKARTARQGSAARPGNR